MSHSNLYTDLYIRQCLHGCKMHFSLSLPSFVRQMNSFTSLILPLWFIISLSLVTCGGSDASGSNNTSSISNGSPEVDSSENSFIVEKLSKLTDPYLNHASLLQKLPPSNFHPAEQANAGTKVNQLPSMLMMSAGINEWPLNRPPPPHSVVPAFLEKPIHTSETLLDRTLTQAKYNTLAAKLSKLIFVFFLESFLFQLYGVELTD